MFVRICVVPSKRCPRVSAKRPRVSNTRGRFQPQHKHAPNTQHTPTRALSTHTQHARGAIVSKRTCENNDIPLSCHMRVVWCVVVCFLSFAECHRCVFSATFWKTRNLNDTRQRPRHTHTTRGNALATHPHAHITFTPPLPPQHTLPRPHTDTTRTYAHTQRARHTATQQHMQHTTCNIQHTHEGIPCSRPLVVWILVNANVADEVAQCSGLEELSSFACFLGGDDRGAQEQFVGGSSYSTHAPQFVLGTTLHAFACKSLPSMVRWVVGSFLEA